MRLYNQFAIVSLANLVAAAGLYTYHLPTPFWASFIVASLIYNVGVVLAYLQREQLSMNMFLAENAPKTPDPLTALLRQVKIGTIDKDGKPELLN